MSIVAIPGQPGERIDARILPDVLAIIRTFRVKITDGFATTGHTPGGEHPLGLAVDVVPDTARGGTWEDVDRLAAWAEPRQNAPRSPFRWVGYQGDPGHGKGDHLHLSWQHSGQTVTTAHGSIPDKDGGDGGGLSAGLVAGVAGSVIAGPIGAAAGTVAGLAGKADDALGAAAGVAGDAAGAAAKALLNVLWDAFGADGARILLYVVLALGGSTLAVVGVTRMFGVSAPNPVQLAALATPAGRVAGAAGKAATAATAAKGAA